MKLLAIGIVVGALAAPLPHGPQVAPARAGGLATADPCGAPLPVQLAFTSGPLTAQTTLRGGGASMSIAQFVGSLNGAVQRIHRVNGGPPLARNDRVAEFTFYTPGRKHLYAGPIHVFRHGTRQHVCRAGVVMVDAHGNTTEQPNPYRVTFRFDGWIAGTRAWGDVWTGKTHFRLTGTTRTMTRKQ